MKNFVVSALMAFSGAALAGTAMAQSQVSRHIEECQAPEATIDALIVHCTVAIKSGDLTPQQEARAFLNRGVAFFARKQYTLALRDYGLAQDRDPTLPVIFANKANTYLRMGDANRAVSEYDQALRLSPKDVPSHVGRGSALVKLSRHSEAAESFSRAINYDPENVSAYYNRALARLKLGDRVGAIRDFDAVVRLSPEDAEAYVARGRAQAENGSPNAAYDDYSRAIEIDPGYAYAYYIRGRLLYDDTQVSKANKDLARAYKLGLDEPWLSQYIAELGQQGRFARPSASFGPECRDCDRRRPLIRGAPGNQRGARRGQRNDRRIE